MGKRNEKPKFGTVEHMLLAELQKEISRACVHMIRRSTYRSISMTMPDISDSFDPDDENSDEIYRTLAAETHNRYLNSTLSGIEDEGLLSALGRIRRLMVITKKRHLVPIEMGARMKKLGKFIKEVRDMREHYDEYICGDGKFPKLFVREHEFKDGSVMAANAKWTVQVGAEEMLGCRLNVTEVAEAIGELRREMENEGLWLLSCNAIELAKKGSEIAR